MSSYMDPLNGNGTLKYDASGSKGKAFTKTVKNINSIMAQNLMFGRNNIDWYSKFNRFGWINPFDHDQVSREYLFFTKPDLFIMNGHSLSDAKLNSSLSSNPFFVDAFQRHIDALGCLQSGLKDSNSRTNTFMTILSNAVTSKLDLPGISAESQESTSNLYGTTISYRSHSMKSDNGFDFSLSFTDTAYLEIYTLAKAYDEYMRLLKTGQIDFTNTADSSSSTYLDYIKNIIDPTQFSIYKFLVGSDGETILYYAKLTGCYFTDVPRSDFSDPGNDGFKFSLGFHANFVEDNNPLILSEFNYVSQASTSSSVLYADVYNSDLGMVNNAWGGFPCIRAVTAKGGDKRTIRRGVQKDYRLKWTNASKDSRESYSSGSNDASSYSNPGGYSSILIDPQNFTRYDDPTKGTAAGSDTDTNGGSGQYSNYYAQSMRIDVDANGYETVRFRNISPIGTFV